MSTTLTSFCVGMSLGMSLIGLGAILTSPITGIICMLGGVCWGIIAADLGGGK